MKITNIKQIIEAHACRGTGSLGVYFKDLQTGETAEYHAEEPLQSASVFKVFVLAELFRQIKDGKHTLQDRYPLKTEDKSEGSGVLLLLDDGMELTIKDYATLMMIISDNTAADFLFKLVGRDNILEHVIRPLGLTATKCDLTCSDLVAMCFEMDPGETILERFARGGLNFRNTPPFTCGMEMNDECSVKDVSKVLELLYHGEWMGRELDDEALAILKSCQTNARIPKYLPKGTVVAHKTGSMDRVANDAGIVYTPQGDYILSMFYNGNTASAEEYESNDHAYFSEELLAHLSEAIYREYPEGEIKTAAK
ncbi:MAG: serine hydrolase [Firmicutes bacterium]|nr:serine hydrolase [Bacillota bacterium]